MINLEDIASKWNQTNADMESDIPCYGDLICQSMVYLISDWTP